jgi:hypothetical protein
MKVFLGWSGDTSHKVALALHGWLPRVIQTIVPYVSSEDIAKGARWIPDIAKELQASKYGIICVTRDNVNSPWINFEAGSLSKEIDQAYVSPFLFNLKPSEINGPLSQFQHTVNERDDLKKLVFTINDKKEHVLQKDALEEAFDMWWPKLETKLAEIEKEGSNSPTPPTRDTQSMLEELLETTRALRLDGQRNSSYQETSLKALHAENKIVVDMLMYTRDFLARNAELQRQLEGSKPDSFAALVAAMSNKSDSEQKETLMDLLKRERGLDSIRKPTSGMPPPPEPEPDK